MSYSTCCPLTGTHDSVIALLSKRIERSTSSGLSDQIRSLPWSGEYEMIFPVVLFHPKVHLRVSRNAIWNQVDVQLENLTSSGVAGRRCFYPLYMLDVQQVMIGE